VLLSIVPLLVTAAKVLQIFGFIWIEPQLVLFQVLYLLLLILRQGKQKKVLNSEQRKEGRQQ
jgi:hypothetical protein